MIFRNGGGNLHQPLILLQRSARRQRCSTTALVDQPSPFNGSHSPVSILPKGPAGTGHQEDSSLSLNRPSTHPGWNTTRNSPGVVSAGTHRGAPVLSPPNDDHPNLFCQSNCLALWPMRLPAPDVASERNPLLLAHTPLTASHSTRAASARLRLTCLQPWRACDKDGRQVATGKEDQE